MHPTLEVFAVNRLLQWNPIGGVVLALYLHIR